MSPEFRSRGIVALIFDFDGTLAVPTLDFAHMKREARKVIARFCPVPEAAVPTMELLDIVEAAHPDLAEAIRPAVLQRVREVEVEAAARSSLFPYVRPMLAACRTFGLQTGIITRNCPEAITRVFPDIAEHFPCIVTRDDVPRVKPDPEHLLAALEQLGVSPEETLMIGDHPMDIVVGQRAGTFTAGLATGEASLEELRSRTPDYCEASGEALMRRLGIFS